MNIVIIGILILALSFVFAVWSMKDMRYGEEIKKLLAQKTIKGAILFFKNKIVHYHSSKSSFSSLN